MRKNNRLLQLILVALIISLLYLFFQRTLVRQTSLAYPKINISQRIDGQKLQLSKELYDKYARVELGELGFDEKSTYRIELIDTDDDLVYKTFFDKDATEIKSGFAFQLSESVDPSIVFVFVHPSLTDQEVVHELNRNVLYGLAFISEDSKKISSPSYLPDYQKVRASLSDVVKNMYDESSYFLELK